MPTAHAADERTGQSERRSAVHSSFGNVDKNLRLVLGLEFETDRLGSIPGSIGQSEQPGGWFREG